MLYLSGVTNDMIEHVLIKAGIGLLVQPATGLTNRIPRYANFACDNGCFSQGADFKLDNYLAWLDKLRPHAPRALFATAPDVVGDARATWERSKDVLPQLRNMGYKAALVAQDGLERMEVDWSAFDCLFIGGTTDWKLSSASRVLCEQARAQGKHVHVGRVNSKRRIDIMAGWPVDSVDGTYLAFGPNVNIRKLTNWLAEVEHQQRFAA